MNNWIKVLDTFRSEKGLSEFSIIPESSYLEIAERCGPQELKEVKERLKQLSKEEKEIPSWDGDSLDEVFRARQLLEAIVKSKEK